MEKVKLTGWEITINQNGVKMATLNHEQFINFLKYNEYLEEQVKLCNKPAVIGSLPSDVEDYIVKTSAYFDNDFKMKGNKEIEYKLKRHSDRLIAKYAS